MTCQYRLGPCIDGTLSGTRCGETATTIVRGEDRCDRHGPKDEQ